MVTPMPIPVFVCPDTDHQAFVTRASYAAHWLAAHASWARFAGWQMGLTMAFMQNLGDHADTVPEPLSGLRCPLGDAVFLPGLDDANRQFANHWWAAHPPQLPIFRGGTFVTE